MNLQELLNIAPELHEKGGKPTSYTLSHEALSFIDTHVGSGSKTLETGAGVSTILFALKGCEHTCVVPDKRQVERIKQFCQGRQISADKIRFEINGSENVLPYLKPSGLDLLLIDGCHGFPAPFIDWYYAASGLKAGGILIIDDTHLWTGDILRQFLLSESGWRHECDLLGRTAVFRRLEEGELLKEWCFQPYTVLHSRLEGESNTLGAKARRAVGHVLKGEFSTLARKVVRNVTG